MHACIHIHLFECKPKRPYSRHLYIHCIISTVQWIPWCGLLINTKTLDMQADFSRYVGKGLCLCTCDALDQHIYIYIHVDIRDNMTIVCHSKPLQSLKQKTIQYVLCTVCTVYIYMLMNYLLYTEL